MQEIREGHVMKKSRITERRHGFDSGRTFPFTNRTGNIVYEDRRTMPDRRLGNISLEVLVGPAAVTALFGGKKNGHGQTRGENQV